MAGQATSPPLVQMWQDHYQDMPFNDFAQKVWAKSYSDMPFETFAARAQIIPVSNAGFGDRSQREPDTLTREDGTQVNTIPYATGMADKIRTGNAGDAGAEGAFSIVPGFQKAGSAIDAGLSQIGFNGPGVTGPISYEDRLSQVRGAEDANRAMHPMARMAGQGVGLATVGLLAPELNVARLGTVGNAALTGAGYGGLQGAVDSDGGVADKLRAGAEGAAIGGVGGLALGAAGAGLGKVLGPKAAGAATPGQQAVEAAARQGLTIPRIAATDNPVAQRLGQGVAGTWVGTPVGTAVREGGEKLGSAVDNLAASAGTPGDAAVTGANLRAGVQDFADNASRQAVTAEEKKLANLANPQTVVPQFPDLVATLDTIGTRRANAGIGGQSSAVRDAMDLATRPGGANIEGLRTLRTYVGEQLNGLHPNLPADFNHAEAKQVYAALTRELKQGYGMAGGQAAIKQFDRANAMNRMMSTTRKQLAQKLLMPGQSTEGVYRTVVEAAKSGGRANGNLLMQVKGAIPKAQWDDFTASVIQQMGRDANGNFSPTRFLTDHSKLSDVGKNTLFSVTQRDALADLAKVSERYAAVQKLANHSNTGNVNSALALGGGITMPLTTLTTALGGNILARLLAKPAATRGMANWSNAYGTFMQQHSAQAAKLLQSQTKTFALLVARELGDVSQGPKIENAILGTRHLEAPPNPSQSPAGK